MKILIVSATLAELDRLIHAFDLNLNQYQKSGNHLIKPLITGVGLLHTAFALQAEIHTLKPDFILNAGIAGTFNPQIQLGEPVFIEKEFPGDLGALAPEGFLPAASLGLLQADDFPYRLGGIEADTPFFDYSNLRKVQSITVQQVTGSEDSIYRMRQTWPQADIENMEGLAVFYVSKKTGIPCAAIRTISNRVEPRNRDNWKIQEAILNLNQLLINLFSN